MSPDSRGSSQGATTYRQTRGTAGEADVRDLARTLPLDPLQLGQLGQLCALLDELGDAGEAGDGLVAVCRGVDDEDAIAGQPDGLGGLEGGLKQGSGRCEEHGGVGRLELVLELLLIVGGAGGCCYAVETLDCVRHGDVVDLVGLSVWGSLLAGPLNLRRWGLGLSWLAGSDTHSVDGVNASNLLPLGLFLHRHPAGALAQGARNKLHAVLGI